MTDIAHDDDHTHHYHSLIMRPLDRPNLDINATPPIADVEEAHSHIAGVIKELKESIPQAAEACDAYLTQPPGTGVIIIGNAAFGVVPCCEDVAECRQQLDMFVDIIVADFEAKHSSLRALMAAAVNFLKEDGKEPPIGGYL